jgi:NAD(P)-dependent dehydrogenase (short-subunit alcohol dehydrogenase family)
LPRDKGTDRWTSAHFAWTAARRWWSGPAPASGGAIALAFGAVGATVGCVDRSEATAQATMREISAAGGKAEAIACDVTDEAAVNATVARFLACVRAAPHPRQWRGLR